MTVAGRRPRGGGALVVYRLRLILAYLLLAIWAFAALVPFVWMVSSSLKDFGQIFRFPPTFIPDPVVYDHYQRLFKEFSFSLWTRNSFYVAASVTIGQLISCSMAAYAFARIPFRGRGKVFFLYLCTMMVPGQITIIPAYILMIKLRLVDSLEGLIVPAFLGGPFGTFLLRQFFMTIPRELEDAAYIDGAGRFEIYSRIILPLSKPALATLGVFTFMNSWNSFLWPLILIDSARKKTLPVGIAGMIQLGFTEWGMLMAGACLSLVPILIVFFSAQSYFVQGITMTGIKG